MERPIITLTTDFGAADPFVGAMKGVIYSICRDAAIADITHGIEAFDILGGALTIVQACPYYPAGSVHVVVVDPGVGSERRPILAEADGHIYVAPDNGVLTLVLQRAKVLTVRHITNTEYFRHPVSQTFHGRDVFAPIAAHVANGIAVESLGPEIADHVQLDIPKPQITEGAVRGQVLKTDRFGNLLTNLTTEHIPERFTARCGDVKISKIAKSYAEGTVGEVFFILGSSGFYEISAQQSSAAEIIGGGRRLEILVTPKR